MFQTPFMISQDKLESIEYLPGSSAVGGSLKLTWKGELGQEWFIGNGFVFLTFWWERIHMVIFRHSVLIYQSNFGNMDLPNRPNL